MTTVDGCAPFLHFLRHMQQYESQLFSHAGCSRLIVNMQNLIGVDLNSKVPTSSFVLHRNFSSTDSTRLCNLICAYRLFDVIVLINGKLPRGPHIPRNSLEANEKSIYGLERLWDWPSILFDLHDISRKAVRPASPALDAQGGNPTSRLLRMLIHNEWSKSFSAVAGNVLVAALHLACMKDLPFAHDSHPDLPDKLDGLVNRLSMEDARCLNISAQSEDDLRDLAMLTASLEKHVAGKGNALSCLRAPLHLALLISPIYLLLPLQLSRKSFNRETMLSISRQLGNAKGAMILAIEKLIWTTLFSLAEGNLHPAELLCELADNLPWDLIEHAQDVEDERNFFVLKDCQLVASVSDQLTVPLQAPSDPKSPTGDAQPCTPVSETDACMYDQLTTSHGAISHPISPTSEIQSSPPVSPPTHLSDEFMSSAEGCQSSDPHHAEVYFAMPDDLSGLLHDDFFSSSDYDTIATTATAPGMEWPADTTSDSDIEGRETEIVESAETVSQATEAHYTNDREKSVPEQGTSVGSVDRESSCAEALNSTRSSNRLKQIAYNATTPLKTQETPNVRSKSSRHKRLRPEDGPPTSDFPNSGNILQSSIWEPATVTEFTEIEEISLIRDQIPKKIACDTEVVAFDPEGHPHRFRPKAHYPDYNLRVKKFFERIASGYQDNQPLHIADPAASGFTIISAETFNGLPSQELHKLLRHKNIVVTGCKSPEFEFNKTGLHTLASLDSQVSIQDYTFPPGKGGNSTPQTVSGLVRDILENAERPDGKILNGLEFPQWYDNPKERSAYAVDVIAWNYVRGKPYCGNLTTPYPTEHVRWGLAGTADAVTFIHIDSDGLATFVRVMCGKKVWATYREAPELPLSSVNVFLDKDFLIDELLDTSTFGLEAVVLRPGDLLFMRPGIPHFVYGPEHTITNGGHFYATCQMQATLTSLVHSFVIGKFITNIHHHPSRQLLRRIVVLYGLGLVENRIKSTDPEYAHLPDVKTLDGLLDLLSACILAILGNILDLRTYSAPNQREDEDISDAQKFLMEKYDRNHIPSNERQAIIHARGVALSIFDWVRSDFIITGPHGKVVDDLPSRFFVQIIKAVVNYKQKAMRQRLQGADHCDTKSLRKQVTNVVECDKLIKALWASDNDICDNSLAFAPKDGYLVERKVAGNATKISDPTQYLLTGMTPFDLKFRQGEALRSTKESVLPAAQQEVPPLKKPRHV